jgi:antitoxin (DNA-binding transcriptional repressor) of toxin-antitoxin stability system
MQRIAIADAERDFSNLIQRVCAEGVGFELALDGAVVAHLVPAVPQSPVKAADLNALLARLPKLEEDSAAFSADIEAIRSAFPAEKSAWD